MHTYREWYAAYSVGENDSTVVDLSIVKLGTSIDLGLKTFSLSLFLSRYDVGRAAKPEQRRKETSLYP